MVRKNSVLNYTSIQSRITSQKAVAFLQSDVCGCKASSVVFIYLMTFHTRYEYYQIHQWTSWQQRTCGWCHILTSQACSQAYANQPCSAETTGSSHENLTAWESSEYEPISDRKGCLPSRPQKKKKGPQKLQELYFSLATAAEIRNKWSKMKSSRNKIYPHKPKCCSPSGHLRRMPSMKMFSLLCLHCPPMFLVPNSAKEHFLEEDRKAEKGQNIKWNTFFYRWLVWSDILGFFLSISFKWN